MTTDEVVQQVHQLLKQMENNTAPKGAEQQLQALLTQLRSLPDDEGKAAILKIAAQHRGSIVYMQEDGRMEIYGHEYLPPEWKAFVASIPDKPPFPDDEEIPF